jgi:NDP-sugar pyrophosphorylase family protein
MKAVLLAAGRGTRLEPLTHSIPKILAPLDGRPLLDHQLRYLAANGVTEVAINVHHHARQVQRFLDRAGAPLRIHMSYEAELLGTAGALVPLRGFLDETFVVLYGDVVTDTSLPRLVAAHRRAGALATLACVRDELSAAKGLVEVGDSGRVLSFREKVAMPVEGAVVNAGIYILEPEVLNEIEVGFSDFGHDVWPRLVAVGADLRAVVIRDYVRDIGSPEALRDARADLVGGVSRW